MTHRPLVLPRLSRAEATASRVCCAPRAELTVLAGPLKLILDESGTGEFGPDQVRISIGWGTDRLDLKCPAGLPFHVLRALDCGLDTTSLPPDLAGILLEAALLPAMTIWEQATGRDVVILTMERDASAVVPDGLRLVLEDGETRWRLHVSDASARNGAPPPTVALVDLWPVAPRPMARFAVPAVLRIGTTRLPLAAVASLRPDDAVLLETTRGKGGMLVIAETWTAAAQHDSVGWRLLEAPRRAREHGETEWTMQDGNAAEGGLGVALLADPDELPVQLTFEVGRLEITLGELRRLGPGSVLELGRSTAELVRVSAHGRWIGHGELVEVEGAVAVRMVRLFDYG